jgi:hypothetical protein
MEKGRAGSPRAGCLPLAELGVLLSRHVFHSIRAEQDVFRTGRGGCAAQSDPLPTKRTETPWRRSASQQALDGGKRVAFGFTCRLVYDESGLVLDYPGIAVRAV